MRYTVQNTVELGICADVWLNGELVKDVIEADTDEGYILRAKRNEAGDIFIDGDEYATERLEGVVTVETRNT